MRPLTAGADRRPAHPMLLARTLLAILLLTIMSPASATTLVRLSLDRIVSASDAIVQARVDGVRTFWEGKQIVTEVTLQVTRALKGPAAQKMAFAQLGGTVMQPVPITLTVPGAPVQSVGDRGFYFLAPELSGRRVIVGLSQGRVLEKEDGLGAFVVFQGRRRTPGEFADEIRGIMAGQASGPGGRVAPR